MSLAIDVDAVSVVDAMQCSRSLRLLFAVICVHALLAHMYIERGSLPIRGCLLLPQHQSFQHIHSTVRAMRPVSLGAGPPSPPPGAPAAHTGTAAPSRRASTTLTGAKQQQQQRSSRAKKAAKGKENVEPAMNGNGNASIDMDIVKESSSGASMVQLAMSELGGGAGGGDTRRTASGEFHGRQHPQQLPLPAAGDVTAVAKSRRQQRRRQMRKPLLHSGCHHARYPTRPDGPC